jgi:diguanylate cyclase (GGDEF)-like protein
MKDVSFYEIVISKDDQKIISADAHIYDVLGDSIQKPIYDIVAPEDTVIFQNNIKNCDGNWYPSKFIGPNSSYYTYVKAVAENERFIRLTVVNAADLLNSHSSLMKTINSFQAQLNLYEDVFFEYNPEKETVQVYNIAISEFEPKEYTIDQFEEILLKRANGKQVPAIKGFITQVKAGIGRSTTTLEGNLLNDDAAVTHTILDEAYVLYDQNTEGVVGHIQLQRNRGNITPVSIKRDSLTGLVDKTDILKIAKEKIDENQLEGTALAIIDIDFFKNVNDTYGHKFGDEVIKKVADIISNDVGAEGVSGRFGGDEFIVLLYNITSEKALRGKLKGIKNMVSATFPDKGIDKDNPLSVSIGAAVFPKDAGNYDDLFALADHCLYLAKERGRNRYVFYTPSKHGTLEDIKLKQQNSKMINERNSSYGDVIIKMFNTALHDASRSIEEYMSEFAEAFGLQNVMLFVGEPFNLKCTAGKDAVTDQAAIDLALGVLNSDDKNRYFALGDFVVINRLEVLPPYARKIKDSLEKRGIYSLIISRFYDRDNREFVLIITSVGKLTLWNQTHFKYYRAFIDLLSLHSLK